MTVSLIYTVLGTPIDLHDVIHLISHQSNPFNFPHKELKELKKLSLELGKIDGSGSADIYEELCDILCDLEINGLGFSDHVSCTMGNYKLVISSIPHDYSLDGFEYYIGVVMELLWLDADLRSNGTDIEICGKKDTYPTKNVFHDMNDKLIIDDIRKKMYEFDTILEDKCFNLHQLSNDCKCCS